MNMRRSGIGATADNAGDLLARRREERKKAAETGGHSPAASADTGAEVASQEAVAPARSGTGVVFAQLQSGLQAQVAELMKRLEEAGPQLIPTKAIGPSRFYNRFETDLDADCDPDFKSLYLEISADGGNAIPALVMRRPDGDGFELVYGHRRWAACKKANYDLKTFVVEGLSERELAILQIKENSQRKTPSILDRARQVFSQFSSGAWKERQELAAAIGVSPPYVTMLLEIGTHIPAKVLNVLQMSHPSHHKITYKQAKALTELAKKDLSELVSRIEWVRTRKSELTCEEATTHLLTGKNLRDKGKASVHWASSNSGVTLKVRGMTPATSRELTQKIEDLLNAFGLEFSANAG